MKAAEWIDRAKARNGWPSDYKAAQALGITRGAMSQIRNGDSATLGEKTSKAVAELTGNKPEAVYLDQVAESVKDPALRAAVRRAVDQLCILCKVPLLQLL